MSIEHTPTVHRFDDVYDLVDVVESEIGWARTVDGIAALIGAEADYRNGEGADPLDNGDTRWDFAVIIPDPEAMDYIRFIECECGQWEQMHAEEQRWHSQTFEWMQNIDNRLNNEAIYRCPECRELVVSRCAAVSKED